MNDTSNSKPQPVEQPSDVLADIVREFEREAQLRFRVKLGTLREQCVQALEHEASNLRIEQAKRKP